MEDDELASAIALSLQSNAHASKPGSSSKSSASEFLAQRARDEKARLERLGQASTSGDNSRVGTRRSRDEDDEDELPAAKRQVLENRVVRSSSSNGLFWDGEYSQPRADGKPTFKMSEVIGNKKDVAFAIISSFVVDIGWISRSFDSDTPVILVTQPGADGRRASPKFSPNWIQTTPFLAGGYGCYHIKGRLSVVLQTGRLRVVVSSANLTVWLQDIPLLETPDLGEKAETTFAGSLQYILNNVHVKTRPSRGWSSEGPSCCVDSGKHEGWEGVVRYSTSAIHLMPRLSFRPIELKQVFALECQGSSIGSYTTQWLNRKCWVLRRRIEATEEFSPIKIVYPTNGTVVKVCYGAQGGGGTLFCRERQWNGRKGGTLQCIQRYMIIALPVDKKKRRTGPGRSNKTVQAIGWAYIGSHNFTASAWGEMTGEASISQAQAKPDAIVRVFNKRPAPRYKSGELPWVCSPPAP
ncbi:hypothetical protein BKA70DRAFT_1268851 [Coprinopsis sp. MPI-PUGE-AT-0042]|nr:hypothetical protein BKA70DRAFT_1268851 [Coprinopsis sp. MPI-PUGE-AT-0042]